MKGLFEPGQMIEARVESVTDDSVFIDIQQKSEGVIDKKEFCDDAGACRVREGDVVRAYFAEERGDSLYFTTRLSSKAGGREALENAFRAGIPVEGRVAKEIKGGYEVTLGEGVCGFCPYSQMGYRDRLEPSEYVGRKLTFAIQEYKEGGRNVVLSNRALLEEQERQRLEAFFSEVTEGSVVEGTVQSIEPYGAFVDVKGFLALLPISEISHARVKRVEDAVKVGETITAKVIRADEKRRRVSLSMKALEADPWDSVNEKFRAGQQITGTISRVADFGVFVSLGKGIDGLAHISRLGVGRNTNIRKVYREGDAFPAVIDKIDADARRISLSPVVSSEEQEAAASYAAQHRDDDSGEMYSPFAALLKKKK